MRIDLRTVPSDTDPDAAALQVQAHARLSPARRVELGYNKSGSGLRFLRFSIVAAPVLHDDVACTFSCTFRLHVRRLS